MSRQLNPSQVWSQVPVASRTVEVNTKTGFSLTAGSYSVRASSTQHATANPVSTSITSVISSVTTTRATLGWNGVAPPTSSDLAFTTRITLTNATTVTISRVNSSASGSETNYTVTELF